MGDKEDKAGLRKYPGLLNEKYGIDEKILYLLSWKWSPQKARDYGLIEAWLWAMDTMIGMRHTALAHGYGKPG